MHDQAQAWSSVARRYDDLFVDPYHKDATNPVRRALEKLPGLGSLTVGDLGCGVGAFLPWLAARCKRVVAVDFAEGMLGEARERCKFLKNVTYHHLSFTELRQLPDKLDVAVTMNSLVSADVSALDGALASMRQALKPGGTLFGILPSLEGLHYHVMLLIDLGLERGMTLEKAQRNAAQKAELHGYDFNTATFTFDKIRQHLWLRDEVGYRLARAGFTKFQVRKAGLPWEQFAEGKALKKYPQSWDWAFKAMA
jgi:ubiquinone/menaquinone biosynthesis C-methylase UbiE